MAITNKAKDASEQKDVYAFSWTGQSGTVGPGVTLISSPIASPGVLSAVSVVCQGASVVPTSCLQINRFIAGSGFTTIAGIGSSFLLSAMGISGPLSVSLVAAGSTLLQVLAGDTIQMILGVNSAAGPAMTVVIKKTQDIVQRFGSST